MRLALEYICQPYDINLAPVSWLQGIGITSYTSRIKFLLSLSPSLKLVMSNISHIPGENVAAILSMWMLSICN